MNRPATRTDPDGIIPVGVAHFPIKGEIRQFDYAFLLLPRFTFLAFASAVEPLRIANQLSQRPLFRWRVVTPDGGPAFSSAGIRVEADATLAGVDRKTQIIVCSGTDASSAAEKPVLDHLRRHAAHGGALGGICTGAFTLARAGLLEGREFAVHWENQPGFRELFGSDPSPRMFVIEPRIMTCGGGAASTDMMLEVVQDAYGAEFAAMIGDMCLHGAPRPSATRQRRSIAQAMGVRNPKLLRIIKTMQDNIETPVPLEEIARIGRFTVRQMERQFRNVMNETPSRYYKSLRLEKARSLLFETDMSVTEIAVACGFNSANSFSKSYRAHFGTSPAQQAARDR